MPRSQRTGFPVADEYELMPTSPFTGGSWSAAVGSAAWSPVPDARFGAPISLEEHTSVMPRPAAKV
jgi:hypothetical protein